MPALTVSGFPGSWAKDLCYLRLNWGLNRRHFLNQAFVLPLSYGDSLTLIHCMHEKYCPLVVPRICVAFLWCLHQFLCSHCTCRSFLMGTGGCSFFSPRFIDGKLVSFFWPIHIHLCGSYESSKCVFCKAWVIGNQKHISLKLF